MASQLKPEARDRLLRQIGEGSPTAGIDLLLSMFYTLKDSSRMTVQAYKDDLYDLRRLGNGDPAVGIQTLVDRCLYGIYPDKEDRETLIKAGNGSLEAGLRRVIQEYRDFAA